MATLLVVATCRNHSPDLPPLRDHVRHVAPIVRDRREAGCACRRQTIERHGRERLCVRRRDRARLAIVARPVHESGRGNRKRRDGGDGPVTSRRFAAARRASRESVDA